ncbi:MAG: outer membrane beta-barrel protein, partial [Flavobacteriaceae bacterium]|nr:outer membrane beta-barrel protein [Flavobacteriaceae bacterium]
MKKILTLTLTALLAVGNLTAQDQSKHEFSLWGTGGLSALNYSTDVGDSKGGLGSSLGIGYSYSLTDQWSIGTGLELSFHNSKTTFDSYSDSYASNDGEYDFDFYTTVSGYEEKQNAAFLNIPVVAQFQTPVSGENKFYASGGIKIGIPVTGKYEISNTTMKNSGYYPIWDVDMYS